MILKVKNRFNHGQTDKQPNPPKKKTSYHITWIMNTQIDTAVSDCNNKEKTTDWNIPSGWLFHTQIIPDEISDQSINQRSLTRITSSRSKTDMHMFFYILPCMKRGNSSLGIASIYPLTTFYFPFQLALLPC